MATTKEPFQQALSSGSATSDSFDTIRTGHAEGVSFMLQVWGTFNADLKLQTSPDGGTTWIDYQIIRRPDLVTVPVMRRQLWRVAGTFSSGTANVRFDETDVAAIFAARLLTAERYPVSGKYPLPVAAGTDYETVAASQSDQILGATGELGDYLSGVLIVPATTSPGAVSIKDGNGSAITIFPGGASSVATLHPFFVPIGAKCKNATTPGWKVTTGANVSAVGVGAFT